MRKILLLTAAMVCLAGYTFSQDKVLDKSGKKPKWVNGIEKDYIIVAGSGPDLQVAQQNALTSIKESIVTSVAQNVKSTSTIQKEEANYNNNVNIFLEKFASTTTAQSGKVPFLQGISLSKVEDFYWEKLQRPDKSIIYTYHIKYPFPEFELMKLVSDFKMRDNELTRQLEDLLAQVDQVESVEQIEKNMAELASLKEYFMDARVDQCNLGITRYRSLLNSIELVELESSLGELKYYLRLGGRSISTTKKPVVKSECARVTSIVNNVDNVTIKYDYDNCYEDPENNILVKYRFGVADVQKPFYFDVAANKASIFVSDPFNFTAISKDSTNVVSALLDMTVRSKYDSPFTIDKVVIEWKGIPPVVIDNIGQSFQGKGNHNLKLNVEQPIKIAGTSSAGKTLSLISGYIYYRSNNTGESKTYRIYNHSYTTDW
ncbi:MAG TPA: hypothetical protein PK839_03230 [Tenuifilaceae bacterium]|jgi:hypothetical protein|nr:hypothetical protein [Bacteroidales bacterium]HNT41017.1 hypothetical protein [Tenuifilaceae bacterium]NLI87925.1 hypothetical protein [Bacteroidales bacterium]HOA09192.1 hypothetical protein [Tenuifilaceae bacterium]HOG71782.1 hypothetical protein [Tenuifilaceae bacterium]